MQTTTKVGDRNNENLKMLDKLARFDNCFPFVAAALAFLIES
jgi:hypothetical protein